MRAMEKIREKCREKLFKGFSLKIMILLLISVGSGIFLMLGSIAGVGILGAFHHIASIYHSQTVESSSDFVAAEFEHLLQVSLKPQKILWQQKNLENSDMAKAAYDTAAWHYDFARRELNLVSAGRNAMKILADGGTPFRFLVKTKPGDIPAYPGYQLPKLPENLRWHVSRYVVSGQAAWFLWALDEKETGIWGFRIMQEQLLAPMMKLLRRLCHDNHMKLALFDEQNKMLMAVNYQGELKQTDQLRAGENQKFLEKPLGQPLTGMKIQIVYTPGIFGQLPTSAYRWALIIIGLFGSLLVGSIVYFYGLERTSTNQLALQNDWVLNLAHSLRGPCHSLGVLTEAMKANSDGRLDELYKLASRELEAMDTHCRQFLQLAKKDMCSNTMKLDRVELAPLVDNAVARTLLRYPLLEKDAVKIDTLPCLWVSANPSAACEVLMTVIDNAIKYSANVKKVQIGVAIAENHVKLEIVDHGQGISPEESPLIGSAFFRSARPELEGISGTGIGLYLARESCKTMGWQLDISSQGPDQGTSVTFTIPVSEK